MSDANLRAFLRAFKACPETLTDEELDVLNETINSVRVSRTLKRVDWDEFIDRIGNLVLGAKNRLLEAVKSLLLEKDEDRFCIESMEIYYPVNMDDLMRFSSSAVHHAGGGAQTLVAVLLVLLSLGATLPDAWRCPPNWGLASEWERALRLQRERPEDLRALAKREKLYAQEGLHRALVDAEGRI